MTNLRLPGFAAAASAVAGGRRAWPFGFGSAGRLGGATPGFFRDVSPQLVRKRRRPPARLPPPPFPVRRERCVRPGLSLRPLPASPFQMSRCTWGQGNRPHGALSSKCIIDRTVRSSYIATVPTITRERLPAVSRVEFFREKINQWLHPHQTRFIPLARKTVRSAARFWTARERCSWISALMGPA